MGRVPETEAAAAARERHNNVPSCPRALGLGAESVPPATISWGVCRRFTLWLGLSHVVAAPAWCLCGMSARVSFDTRLEIQWFGRNRTRRKNTRWNMKRKERRKKNILNVAQG